MAFFRHRIMRRMEEAMENLVAAEISMYLHERVKTLMGDHWMSGWLFTTMTEFLIKKTLTFMLRGLATVVQNLTVGKSLRTILSTSRKEKIIPEVTDVVVD